MAEVQNFIINLEVYPFDLMVHFGDPQIMFSRLRDRITQESLLDIQLDFERGVGTGRTLLDEGTGVLLLWIKEPWSDNFSSESFGTLNHEIFHVVELLFDRIGITLSGDSSEAFAYLIGFITRKIHENLK